MSNVIKGFDVIFENLDPKIIRPSLLLETDQFIIKLAENELEIEKAQRLRYQVFNVEQGKGLESARSSGRDHDEFDEYCLHLLVIEKETDKAIGTYRIHLGSVANSAKGFYSSREYAIQGLDAIADSCVELGRSCVSKEYRTGSVVALLWGGIAELLNRANLKIMLGCVSLEENNPAVAWALYDYFKANSMLSTLIKATPRKDFILPKASNEEILRYEQNEKTLRKNIPPLFKGYLRLGCKVCGEPAFDKEFGTIDFLIIVNKDEVPERYVRHFNPSAENE